MNRHVIWPIVVLMALGFIISCGGGGGGGGEPWAPVWVAKWDGGGSESAFALGLQDDGKVLVVGTHRATSTDILLVRFNADGSLDTGFGTGGWATWDGGIADSGRGLALQADGKVLVVGTSYNGTNSDVVLLSALVHNFGDVYHG